MKRYWDWHLRWYGNIEKEMSFFQCTTQELTKCPLFCSMTLYLTQYPLCFTWVMLGYHQGATALSKAILGTLLHLALHGAMGDIGLIILAGSLGVISKLWFAVPIYNIVYVYMGKGYHVRCLLTWIDFDASMDKESHVYKMWDKITYLFQNFNGFTVQVWEMISYFIPYFTMDVITYPCWD